MRLFGSVFLSMEMGLEMIDALMCSWRASPNGAIPISHQRKGNFKYCDMWPCEFMGFRTHGPSSEVQSLIHLFLQISTVSKNVGVFGSVRILHGKDVTRVQHEPERNGELWSNLWRYWYVFATGTLVFEMMACRT